jgi:glycerol-3-phosphate dehydrogenase (NAD(P)+)
MNTSFGKIVILGAGAIGTALGNVLASKKSLNVTLLSIEKEVIVSITNGHINQKYFPNIPLNSRLAATEDPTILRKADIIFLAVPSVVTMDYLLSISDFIPPSAFLVNLAKGFGNGNKTITENLTTAFPNPAFAMKGPSFARELINNMPTSFTLAGKNEELFSVFSDIFKKTPVYLDFSGDVKGVEILSILKNIYAIVIGIVDAHFNSPNLRFMVLTKAFNEMKNILLHFGGEEETLFKYCGIGDFGLTALNDMSRNRTLGLLIGKGFFTENISDKVVLEGKIAVNIFTNEIAKNHLGADNYHIINELNKIFHFNNSISEFVNNIIKK